MADEVAMDTPPPEDLAQGGPRAQQPPPERSKKQQGQGRKGKGKGAQVQEEVPLTASQAEHVRVVRVDARRDAAGEERASLIVQLSKSAKAPAMQLSDDRLSVTGMKGYRTVRATHGVHQGGTWYCEATVTHLGSTGHVRLGWCTGKAELNAPVGFDKFGFCYRDLMGSKVHDGLREEYGQAYGENDVVGLLIHMPDGGRPFEVLDRAVGRYKGSLYFVAEPEAKPEPLKGSAIAFTVNGVLQGVAFTDIPEGTYYPGVSIFTMPKQTEGASVKFNFGPDFKYQPAQLDGLPPAQPYCNVVNLVKSTKVPMDTA